MSKHYTVLGAGLSGLSCSFHLGHDHCTIFESKDYVGGHAHTHFVNNFHWDEGPHISFTNNEYVKYLLNESTEDKTLEFPTKISNYFYGTWIPHPAQSNLHALPDPLKTDCLKSFLEARSLSTISLAFSSYDDWLTHSFGSVFSENFSTAYTQKYWTTNPSKLSLDWIGNRIFIPDAETFIAGSYAPLLKSTHYFQNVRYPERGGFKTFGYGMSKEANISFNHCVSYIDLEKKIIQFTNGHIADYTTLINTLPLPIFIALSNAPEIIKDAASKLKYTSLLNINIIANHAALREENIIYVYDTNKFSTRISMTESFSPYNGVENKTGVQVEVYESPFQPFKISHQEIANNVCNELIEMGVISSIESVHTQYSKFANIIYDHDRRSNQELVLSWLEKFGLEREIDDLEPMSEWNKNSLDRKYGSIILAGRFGQWKYFWSDDCILRGAQIANLALPFTN